MAWMKELPGIPGPAAKEDEIDKLRVLKTEWPQFQLFETLKVANRNLVLLERHLERLRNSALYFDFHFDLPHTRQQLHEYAALLPSEPYRLRLFLDKAGETVLDACSLKPLSTPLSVALATEPISRLDCFLYHKTTVRDLYDRHRSMNPDVDEVLLWNEDGNLTEFTIGNLVAEINGICWTPPIDSGLLAGTMRSELLEKGEIRERYISKKELPDASQLWLINSIRGWLPVCLLTQ